MTKTAFERDNVLSKDERAVSGRKCLKLLEEVNPDDFQEKERNFFSDQLARSKGAWYMPTERQLAWLRDLVSKYAA